MKKILLAMFLLVASFAAAQTVTFTTQGGASYPEHFNVVSEDGVTVSGTVQIAQDYGYPNSGIVLPNNPVAPGEYLNPIIDITAYTVVYGANGATKTETFTFNVANGVATGPNGSTAPTGATNDTNMGWQLESFLFVGDAGATNFSFISGDADSNSHNGAAIGNVSIVEFSRTPEPGFYGLLAAGLAGIAIVRFRRSA